MVSLCREVLKSSNVHDLKVGGFPLRSMAMQSVLVVCVRQGAVGIETRSAHTDCTLRENNNFQAVVRKKRTAKIGGPCVCGLILTATTNFATILQQRNGGFW